MLVAAAAAALIGSALAALVWWPSGHPNASPVARALPFSLPEVQPGRPAAALPAMPGGPVVLNFFASWCGPCHAEVPLLADLHRHQGDRVEVIGVDTQDNRDLAAQLLVDGGASYAAGYDPSRKVSDSWGVDGLPVTVFIAADGTVVDYHRGQLGATDLTRRVDRLLRGATSRAVTGA